MKLIFAAVLLIGLAVDSRAEIKKIDNSRSAIKKIEDMSARVSRSSPVKYSDLLRLVFPDLEADGKTATATKTIPIRHVSGDHKLMSLEGEFELSRIYAISMRDPEGTVTVLNFDLTVNNLEDSAMVYGNEASIVAAFRTSPKPKLLDALDIKSDRWTEFFSGQWTFPVGPNQDGCILINYHDNSSQSYDALSGFCLVNGKLTPVFDLFLLESAGCGMDITQTSKVTGRPEPGNRLYSILISVKLVKKRDDPNCDKPTPGYIRSYSGEYKWNRARNKFTTTSPGLARLDKLNRGAM